MHDRNFEKYLQQPSRIREKITYFLYFLYLQPPFFPCHFQVVVSASSSFLLLNLVGAGDALSPSLALSYFFFIISLYRFSRGPDPTPARAGSRTSGHVDTLRFVEKVLFFLIDDNLLFLVCF